MLAVNTAGMLVRRRVLEELGGFDPQLPIFGNDIDFGWRAATAGHRTVVVPQAVVFHAEAAHRGVRRTPLTGRHTHYQERRAALYTLLVNSRARALPFQVVRLGLGTLLRMIGFLLVRSVGEALDELAALVSLYSSPREILAGAGARGRAAPPATRPTYAGCWPRPGCPTGTAWTSSATSPPRSPTRPRTWPSADARRPRCRTGPAGAAAAGAPRRRGLARRRHRGRRPVPDQPGGASRWPCSWCSRSSAPGRRSARSSGGGLSPTPGVAGDWWRLWTRVLAPARPGQRRARAGVRAAAGAARPPCSAAARRPRSARSSCWPCRSRSGAPGASCGSWAGWSRPAGAPRWLLLWGAVTYALVPVASGAWGDGRLATVVAAALLPWLAHAALGFADPDAGPPLAGRLALGAAARAGRRVHAGRLAARRPARPGRDGRRARDRARGGAAPLGLGRRRPPPSRWCRCCSRRGGCPRCVHGAGAGAAARRRAGPGAAARRPRPAHRPARRPRAPRGGWASLLAVLAAARAAARASPGSRCWSAGSSRWSRPSPPPCWPWSTSPVASTTVPRRASASCWSCCRAPSWSPPSSGRQALSAARLRRGVVAWRRALALVAGRGRRGRPARRARLVRDRRAATTWPTSADTGIPAYMVQSSMTGPAHGILVVRGDVERGLTYSVRRGDGVTLGEDEILDLTAGGHRLHPRRQVAARAAHP